MQLNALFCCLWVLVINISSSSPTAYNQQSVILNLWYDGRGPGGHGPPVTVLRTLACGSVNSRQKPDIDSESRFLPTPPAFDAPSGGFPSEVCNAVLQGKTRMVWLPDSEKLSMICLFILTELTNVTDTRTDRHHMTTWAALA